MLPQPTNTLRRASLYTLVSLAISMVVLYAGCNNTPPPTNQPTPVASITPTTEPTEEPLPEMQDVVPMRFETAQAARDYIAAEIEKVRKITGGHDDPIIITDGSVHIKTTDSLRDDFVLSEDNKKLTRNKPAQALMVAVLVHTKEDNGDPNDDPTEVYRYQDPEEDVKCFAAIRYKNKENFLKLTTREANEQFIIRTAVAFTEPKWDMSNPKEWIYDKTPPGEHDGGHEKVVAFCETRSGKHPGGEHKDKRGKSEVTFLYHVPTP